MEFNAYTYCLHHEPTGKKYYGVRWANRCEPEQDLWVQYFSSSKEVWGLIKTHGRDSFIPEVRKTFSTKQEALAYEQAVLKRLKVWKNPNWLNQKIIFQRSGPSAFLRTTQVGDWVCTLIHGWGRVKKIIRHSQMPIKIEVQIIKVFVPSMRYKQPKRCRITICHRDVNMEAGKQQFTREEAIQAQQKWITTYLYLKDETDAWNEYEYIQKRNAEPIFVTVNYFTVRNRASGRPIGWTKVEVDINGHSSIIEIGESSKFRYDPELSRPIYGEYTSFAELMRNIQTFWNSKQRPVEVETWFTQDGSRTPVQIQNDDFFDVNIYKCIETKQ